MPAQRSRDVITDACVIINLVLLDRLALLARLPGLRFLVPEEVVEEVSRPGQREQLVHALDSTALTRVRVTGIEALITYTEVRAALGAGDAACVAFAVTRGCLVATDDRRVQREVRRRCGRNRLISTSGLIHLAHHHGLISIDEIEQAGTALAGHRELLHLA